VAKLGPGARIGDQFLLIRKIGEGGCGEVYLAEQTSLGRNAVVKLMHPELSRDPSYVARFRREAQLAARLTHHHTAAIYAFGETPDRVLWIAMEYIEGESLHNALAKDSPREIAELLAPVADVLDRAGGLGIIHRDVKPDNIIVSPDGGGRRAVLLDFGLARPMDDNDKLTAVGVAVGSPTYMSPEQVFGPTVDSATDRYAFGIILYIAVAKRPPFRHDDRVQLVLMHKRQPVPALHTLLPTIPPGHPLDAFFTRALAKQPQDRYPSARQMITEFLQALDQAPLGQPHEEALPPPAAPLSARQPLPSRPPSMPQGTRGAGSDELGRRATQAHPLISPRGLDARSGRAAHLRTTLPVGPGWGDEPAPAPRPEPRSPVILIDPAPPVTEPPPAADSPATDPTLQVPEEEIPAPAVRAEEAAPEEADLEELEEEEEVLPGHQRLLGRVISGAGGAGRGLDILCGSEALLGKHRDCEVVCRAFPTPEQDAITHGVSRQHARLRVASGKLFIEDLASLNGTYLDDRRLTAGPVQLHDEARLRLGPVLTIEVRLFKSGAALLSRVDPYHGDAPPTLLLWDKLPLGEPLLGLVPPTGDSVTRWGVIQCSRPAGELWWGGPKPIRWQRGDDSPQRPQALQPGDRLSQGGIVIEWVGGYKPGLG
jgi:serine/threonine protein kinase